MTKKTEKEGPVKSEEKQASLVSWKAGERVYGEGVMYSEVLLMGVK